MKGLSPAGRRVLSPIQDRLSGKLNVGGIAGLGAADARSLADEVRSRGVSQNFVAKVLVQRNGVLDSISFTVARATIPTNYWASG